MQDQDKNPRKKAKPAENGVGKAFNNLTRGLSDSISQIFNPRTESGLFFRAVKENRLEDVRGMIAQGMNPNACNLVGDSALHIAAEHNLPDMAALLMSLGADPLLPQQQGKKLPPLRLALECGSADAARTLIEHNACNIHDTDAGGWTLLHLAVKTNCTAVIPLLLARGADPNAMTANGSTPLLIAAIKDLEDMTLLLLDVPEIARGINVYTNHQDPLRMTAFHHTLHGSSEKVICKMLEKGAYTMHPDGLRRTPLHCAIAVGKTTFVKILLENGADVAKGDCAGIVEFAADPQHIMKDDVRADIIGMLVAYGANPDRQDLESGKTPLIAAIEGLLPETFKTLLRNGANPCACAADGTPPLFAALDREPEQIIPSLLKMGADINQRHGKDGRTALIEAVKRNNPLLIRLLLDKGADPSLSDITGGTALSYARAASNKPAIAMLEEKLVPVFTRAPGTGLP